MRRLTARAVAIRSAIVRMIRGEPCRGGPAQAGGRGEAKGEANGGGREGRMQERDAERLEPEGERRGEGRGGCLSGRGEGRMKEQGRERLEPEGDEGALYMCISYLEDGWVGGWVDGRAPP